MGKKEKILKFSLICIFVFICIFLLKRVTIYTGDDYMNHFFFEQGRVSSSSRRLSGITDIPASMRNHYQSFNGRIVAHSIIQFFMLFDKSIFNICNSIAYVVVGILLLFNIQPIYKKWKAWHLVLVYLFMWLCLPDFGLSVLWVSGAVNYLWMSMLLLGLMAFYRYHHETPQKMSRRPIEWLKAILIIPLAFICGWSSENGGGAVIGLVFLIILIWVYEKRHIPVWAVSGWLASCVGFLFLLKAPSSAAKMDTVYTAEVLLKRIREVIGFSYHYIMIIYIFFFVLAVLFIRWRIKVGRSWKEDIAFPVAYMLSGTASVIVLIASPVIMGKSWIWAVCTAVCAIGQLIWKMTEDGWKLDIRTFRVLIVILGIVAVFNYWTAYKDLKKTYSEYELQLSEIQEQKEQGIRDVTVPVLSKVQSIYNPVMKTPNISTDKDSWFNKWMALYYGADSITGVEK